MSTQITVSGIDQLDRATLPQHVALIMDGNGRWAKARNRPRLYGHQKGTDALRAAIDIALEIGVPVLSAWAFSTANWTRPETEISGLMNLLRHALKRELNAFHKRNIKLRVIGSRHGMPEDLLKLIDAAILKTQDNTALTVVIAFNYDGRSDIVQATQKLLDKVQRHEITPDALTEDMIAQCLMTAGLPDPDLLIRTSGVIRLSNFMMWQCAFTEFVFLEKHWPDFTPQDFLDALIKFQSYERKFGQISA